jgi:glycosyltransferase involved in cell wall biosynthesis
MTYELEVKRARSHSASRGSNDRLQFMYFAPSDLFIPRVDRQCIMRFCEAVAELGVGVEVVSLDVKLDFNEPTRSRAFFDVYSIRTPFTITVLPSRVRQSSDSASPAWRTLVYAAHAFRRLLRDRRALTCDCTFLYFKNYLLGVPLLVARKLLGNRVLLLFEIHVPPKSRWARAILRRCDGVIPVSRILAEELVEHLGLDPSRILVAHMGVNLSYVESVRLSKEAARQRLGLPLERKLAIYTGKVHAESREIDFFIRAAGLLADEADMVIVGGREDHVQLLQERVRRERLENVHFPGFVAPGDIFHWQMAADVLVTYYSSDISLNKYRASPGKLFEYMASGRPIVTADYPALHEALSPGAALFIERDSPDALASGIRTILGDIELGIRLADQAYADVKEFTWERRARRVLDFARELRDVEDQ